MNCGDSLLCVWQLGNCRQCLQFYFAVSKGYLWGRDNSNMPTEESLATLWPIIIGLWMQGLKIDIIISHSNFVRFKVWWINLLLFNLVISISHVMAISCSIKRAYCTRPCSTFFQLDITKVFRCWINKKLSYISQNLLRKNNHILGGTFYRNTILWNNSRENFYFEEKSLKICCAKFQSLKFQYLYY